MFNVRDANCSMNVNGGYGCLYLENHTTSVVFNGSLQIPGGATFQGISAEWIMEPPGVGGGLAPELASYNQAEISNATVFSLFLPVNDLISTSHIRSSRWRMAPGRDLLPPRILPAMAFKSRGNIGELVVHVLESSAGWPDPRRPQSSSLRVDAALVLRFAADEVRGASNSRMHRAFSRAVGFRALDDLLQPRMGQSPATAHA